MSSPVKLMRTSYIGWDLDDEDGNSMNGEIDDQSRTKPFKLGGRLIFLYSRGNALRPNKKNITLIIISESKNLNHSWFSILIIT